MVSDWRSIAVSLALASCLPAPAAASDDEAESPPRPRLQLAWTDPGRVLSDGLLARGHRTVRRELATIFDAAGIDVLVEPLTRRTELRAEALVVVVLAEFDATRWGLPAETLGAVMSQEGPAACVYVFEPAVSRALGLERRRTPGHYYELARALGRVAAHEVVHALVPELAHGRRGLMRARLTRSHLVGERLGMVPATSSAVSARLSAP